MDAETRRKLPALTGLLVVLAVVAWWQFGGGASTPPGSAARRPAAPARPGEPAVGKADDVLARGIGLVRLDEDRPAPDGSGRDPFRSGSPGASGGTEVRSPTRPAGTVVAPPVVPVGPIVPAGPPPPPPIAVKFIGVVSRRDVGKVAVLSDGKNVYYGRAGEIVDGRWRIVSIGEESLQIEYADGRGRQTVRLTG